MTPHTPLSALDPHSPVRLFPDDEFRVVNAVDASKQLAFDLSAIATETTRTVTIPDASGTMALLERAQTFTKLATFALGLTVAGAAFASRGIQDDATARALHLTGGGGNHVTLASSSGYPTVGTNAGGLLFDAAEQVYKFGDGNVGDGLHITINLGGRTPQVASMILGANRSNGLSEANLMYATGGVASGFEVGGWDGATYSPQFKINHTAGTNRWVTATGSNGSNPSVGTNGGHLLLTPNSGTVYISAAANPAYFYYINSANAQGLASGVDAAGHAYHYNYNAAAGISNFYLGNGSTSNTGGVYIYQKGVQRLDITDTEVIARGTSTMILRAKGGTSYGMVVAESPAASTAYFLAVVAGVETARMYSGAAGWLFGTGASASPQFEILHNASSNWRVTVQGGNGVAPVVGTNAGNLALAPFTNIVTVSGQANIGVGYANYINVIGSAGTPQITTAGGATVPLDITTVGGAVISLKTNGYKQVEIVHTPTPAGYLKFTGGTNPNISVSAGYLEFASGVIFSSQTVGTSVGATGAADPLPANPLGYLTTNINGTACKIPYYTA